MVAAALRRAEPRADGLPFTQLPEQIWTDPEVSDLARTVLGYLVAWMRAHPSRFPTTREVAAALGRAECTIRRAIKSLEKAGYLEFGRRRVESRYEAKLGYRLKTPKPRLAPPTDRPVQREFFPDERADVRAQVSPGARPSEPGSAPPINKEETEKTDKTEPESLSVSSPLDSGPVSEEDLAADLLRRASLLWGGCEAKVTNAIHAYGALAVELALDRAEERSPQPEHFAWLKATLDGMAREGKLPSAEKPAASTAAVFPRLAPIPVTAADVPEHELEGVYAQARGGGVLGRLARASIQGWMKKGALRAEIVPPDLRDPPPVRDTGRGAQSANLPPGPAGDLRGSSHSTLNQGSDQKDPTAPGSLAH